MPKGGARISSGPPPNPNSRTQRAKVGEWTLLPGRGRAGRAPRWPLTEPSERERNVWREVWRTPQAIEWEHLGWAYDAALYVRFLVAAEVPDSPSALRAAAEARQWSDRLGLSPAALLRLRWRIVPDELAATVAVTAASDPRVRLRVVAGGGDDDAA